MDIKRSGSQPSGKGPADWFTGTVRIDPLFTAPAPARVTGAAVTFEPGARTAWHTHPLGQTLIVTAGCGRVQREGGPIEEIRPGDVVLVSAGREALARRRAGHRHDPYRRSGKSRRQGRRLDGEGDGRGIPFWRHMSILEPWLTRHGSPLAGNRVDAGIRSRPELYNLPPSETRIRGKT